MKKRISKEELLEKLQAKMKGWGYCTIEGLDWDDESGGWMIAYGSNDDQKACEDEAERLLAQLREEFEVAHSF